MNIKKFEKIEWHQTQEKWQKQEKFLYFRSFQESGKGNLNVEIFMPNFVRNINFAFWWK